MQKGGEELRIDQRVMQLFDLMNGLIAQQPSAPGNLRVRQSPKHVSLQSPYVASVPLITNLQPQGLNGCFAGESRSQA